MKNQFGFIFNAILITVALIVASSCEKEDEITREKIIGDWLLEKEVVNDAWVNGYLLDTTIIYGNIVLSINNSDTAYIEYLDENSISGHRITFRPPDAILINTCPIIWEPCDFYNVDYFKIIELNRRLMLLRSEHEYRGVNTIRDRYYSKLD